ncbi:MAG TPA: hypothetical protein VL328_12330 [Gemmatimonadaceae bacterium]|jgi:uncharacterized protein YfiM (DUF2279 family)|nr:hypothetical protein [Gemmatimonadaceae bacterium]
MRAFILVFSLGAPDPRHHGDRWFGPDKLQHFFASAFVQSLGYGTLRLAGADHGTALGGASATTALVGVGKELRDRRSQGDVSARDLVWDAAGAGAATVLLVRTIR